MVLGSYGKEHMCQFDSRGGLVMPPSAQLDLLQQQQQHQRQWIPDERDAFISWLRGEFAAANAIIDAMCHHLQMSGKPGEYDVVLTCIQARRYNWTIVLHMQQYSSVAEVNFALQQVMWQKKQSLPPEQPSHMPQAQQFYTYPEAIYGGGTHQEITNGVQDPRELREDFVIPRFVAAAQQQSGLEERRGAPENLASAGRSDIPGDRRATGPENDARQQLTPANFEASPSLQPPQSPSAHLQPKAYGENQTEAGSRLSEDAIASPSPTLSAHSSHQNLVVNMSGNQSNADNCLNGNSEGHLLDQPEEKLSPPEDSKEEDPEHLPTGKTSKYYSCSESVDGKMINVAEGLQLFENVLDSSETNQLTLLINGIQAAGRKGGTSVGSTRGFNGQGRDTIHFGCQHPEAHSDISEPIPACLQVIIDRLVAWHLIPPSKVPDSCSIHILDEGDYLPPHIDHSHVERPFYTLTLLSECSLVLGHSLAMDAPGDFKGAFHLSLPVGSVLVLQGSSADIARHALSSSPAKRISIMLGKLLPNKTSRVPPQIASLPHPAVGFPPVSLSSWPPAFNSHLPTQGAKGSSFSNSKPHILGPVSGVLPVPTVRLPSVAQVLPSIPSVASSRLKPLFPAVAVNHSSTYAPTAVPTHPWTMIEEIKLPRDLERVTAKHVKILEDPSEQQKLLPSTGINEILELERASIGIVGRKDIQGDFVEFQFLSPESMARVVGVGLQWSRVVVTREFNVIVTYVGNKAWLNFWKEARQNKDSKMFTLLRGTIPRVSTKLEAVSNLTAKESSRRFGVGLEEFKSEIHNVYVKDNTKQNRMLPLIFELTKHMGVSGENARNSGKQHSGASSSGYAGGKSDDKRPANPNGKTQIPGDGNHEDKEGEESEFPSSNPSKLPAEPPLDTKRNKSLTVTVIPESGGTFHQQSTNNLAYPEGPIQHAAIVPWLQFEFEMLGDYDDRRITTTTTTQCNLGGGEPKYPDLDCGYYHDNITISLNCEKQKAARLKSATVDATNSSKRTISTTFTGSRSSANQISGQFGGTFQIPIVDIGVQAQGNVSRIGTVGDSDSLANSNETLNNLFGGFYMNPAGLEGNLIYNFLHPEDMKELLLKNRKQFLHSGICRTFWPTIVGEWDTLDMDETCMYSFKTERDITSVKDLMKSNVARNIPYYMRQRYQVPLYINHAMTHIHCYEMTTLQGAGEQRLEHVLIKYPAF